MAVLVDTNILVYRFDDRFREKQKIAVEILRRGIIEDSVRLPHQAIVEFVAAVTRPIRGYTILKQADALREAEEFLKQFTVLYPNEAILRHAVRACSAYQLSCSMHTFGHMRNTTGCRRCSLRTFSTIGFMAPSAW